MTPEDVERKLEREAEEYRHRLRMLDDDTFACVFVDKYNQDEYDWGIFHKGRIFLEDMLVDKFEVENWEEHKFNGLI